MPSTADLVIVGGGVIGAACAYYLARAGIKPLLLERSRIGAGASGSSDGMVFLQSKLPGPHLEMALRSAELYRTLEDELDAPLGYRACGGLQVALSEGAQATFARHRDALKGAGVPAEVLDAQEVRGREPHLAPAVKCGLFSPYDAQVDPWLAVRAFADAAQKRGATVIEGVAVEKVRAWRGRVRAVVTTDREVATPAVLNCAGAWARAIQGAGYERLSIEPQRGEALVTEPAPPTIRHVILGADYVSEKYRAQADRADDSGPADARVALALEQTASGNVLIGSSREPAGDDRRTSPQVLARIADLARRVLPRLQDLHLLRTFAGLRPHTRHGLPLLGAMVECEGAYVAAGHCGDGICLAPVTGEVMSRLIAQNEPTPWSLAPGAQVTVADGRTMGGGSGDADPAESGPRRPSGAPSARRQG